MDPVQVVALVVAILALVVAILAPQWQNYRRDRVNLRVDVSWAAPVCDIPGGSRRVGDSYVKVTATNVGRLPAGVTGMGFDTTDGRTIPLTDMMPAAGNELPAVLQPGEQRVMWVLTDELKGSLREERTRLRSAHAHGPGGRHRDTTQLGGVGKLGE